MECAINRLEKDHKWDLKLMQRLSKKYSDEDIKICATCKNRILCKTNNKHHLECGWFIEIDDIVEYKPIGFSPLD